MYAIFDNGGKQYRVQEGDSVRIEKIAAEKGSTVEFPAVFAADGDKIFTGDEAKAIIVTAQVVDQGKAKKIIVYKYKAKKNERKKQGHRQPFTQIKITKIGGAVAEAPAKKAPSRKKKAEAKEEAKAVEEAPAETAEAKEEE